MELKEKCMEITKEIAKELEKGEVLGVWFAGDERLDGYFIGTKGGGLPADIFGLAVKSDFIDISKIITDDTMDEKEIFENVLKCARDYEAMIKMK